MSNELDNQVTESIFNDKMLNKINKYRKKLNDYK